MAWKLTDSVDWVPHKPRISWSFEHCESIAGRPNWIATFFIIIGIQKQSFNRVIYSEPLNKKL